MPFHINIRDVYELGTLVTFWGALDPTDGPVTLPSRNPFQIWHEENLIHQPQSSSGEVLFSPNERQDFHWDQKDGFYKVVSPGAYNLRFFLKELDKPIEKQFAISTSTKDVLKSLAKWARRGCLSAGPFVILGAPIVGTIVTFLAVPFEMIENDPANRSYELLYQVGALDLKIEEVVDDPVCLTIVKNTTKLGLYLSAIKETMERLEGAALDQSTRDVEAQETHLSALRADASISSNQIANSIGEMSRSLGSQVIDYADVLESMHEAASSWRVREFVEAVGGTSQDIDKTLEDLRSLGGGQVSAGPKLRELQFEFQRLSNSLHGSKRPEAIAA